MTLPREYEDQLVERAKQDADAFGELYDHYFGQMYRFVYSRTRNVEVSEDIVSEVFFKALKALPRYDSRGYPFSSWLYQICSNAIVDHHRRAKPTEELDARLGLHDEGTSPDESVADQQSAAHIWAQINMLPEQQRMAITLKISEDLKLSQIAEIMGKSEGAIKLLIHRGMVTLRYKLSAEANS